MSDEAQALASLDLVATHVEKQLDVQWNHWDDVDGRLRLLLGFVSAVFVAVLAFASNESELTDGSRVLLVIAVCLLFVSGGMAALAWMPRKFDRPPEPMKLRDTYLAFSEEETRLAILDTMLEAYGENQRRINEKLASFRYAACVLGSAMPLIGVAAIIEIVG